MKNPASTSVDSRVWVIAAVVSFAAFLAYLPALSGEFIWNDSDYVTAPGLRSIGGLVRIWTEPGAVEQYYPFLHSAFWVQHGLFGDRPLGYHIVTLLLHCCAAVMFVLVVNRLAGRERTTGEFAPAAWIAALIFALHPVHVQSVAWIAEQKNTLSLVFYLAAALGYLRFDEGRERKAYFTALVFFVLALFSKSVTATLPAALLVVFWWKRGRIDWRRDAVPLIPWLAIGAAFGLFGSWVERTYVGAHGADFDIPFAARILVAGRSVWFYLGKFVWPFGLNMVYPRWAPDPVSGWQWLFPIGVLAVVAALWVLRSRARGPLAAFLIFLGSLFPALGFVNLYGARYSWVWDHWLYLPDLSLIFLAAEGLTGAWIGAWVPRREYRMGLAAALAVFLGALTWSHAFMFQDDATLYREILKRNPGAWMAHNNLGMLLQKDPSRLNEAVAEYQQALRLNPNFAEAHNNLGDAWVRLPGRMREALGEFERAVSLEPDLPGARLNLALALMRFPDKTAEAVAQFRYYLRLKSGNAQAWHFLGGCLAVEGDFRGAADAFQQEVLLSPDDPVAKQALAAVRLRAQGR